jgi:hypothetical protein
LFLATYLTSVNLLIPVAGSTAKCNSPDLCKTQNGKERDCEGSGRDNSRSGH